MWSWGLCERVRWPSLSWCLCSLGRYPVKAAAFDTRVHGPAALTGRASKGVARLLREHGFDVAAEPESFLVTRQDRLEPQETARAREWEPRWPRASRRAEANVPGVRCPVHRGEVRKALITGSSGPGLSGGPGCRLGAW